MSVRKIRKKYIDLQIVGIGEDSPFRGNVTK